MSTLRFENVTTTVPTPSGAARVAHGINLTIRTGTLCALIGESGAGKSMLAAATVGMLPPGSSISGTITLDGVNLAGAPEKALRNVRGNRVAVVPQSPATMFTPHRTIRSQLAETVNAHRGPRDVHELAALTQFPAEALNAYPHELSGGMAQRAGIAAALAGNPDVLIADEPTSGLDPHLTDATLRTLRTVTDNGVAVLLITHDIPHLIDTGIADQLAVMSAGELIDQGPANQLLHSPTHPYTQALLAALPRNGMRPLPGDPLPPEPTLEATR